MRRFVSLLLLTAMLLALGGCIGGSGEKVTVYLMKPLDASQPVGSVEVEVKQRETPAKAAMRALVHPPQNSDDLRSPFADGVEVIAVEESDGVVTVRLSEKYLDMKGVALAEAESCTALTLCSIDGISGVELLVDGRPHPQGSKDVLSASGIVYEEIDGRSLEREITLYFCSSESGRLYTESRGVTMREGEPIERYVIDELIKGSSQSDYRKLLPSGLELLDAVRDGDICSLNFSAEFRELADGRVDDELNALISIANSIIASSSAEAVRFLVEGEPLYLGAPLYECGGADDPYSYAVFEVWLPSNDGEHVEPAKTVLPTDGMRGSDEMLIDCLINGPDGSGFFSPLPDGTRVLREVPSQDNYYIDFSAELVENISDAYPIDMALKCLVHTLYHNGYALRGLEVAVEGEDFRTVSANAEDIHPDFR